MDEDLFIYYLIGVPVLGILAQWLAWRFRLPSILLLLGFGIALGEFFRLDPDVLLSNLSESELGPDVGPRLLFPLVTLAVAIVLFEGGLSLRFSELKGSGSAVMRLVTVGVVIGCVTTSVLAYWLFDFDYYRIALLIGAVLVVTGPTVVAPLLRHIRPHRRVGSIIKWEGIVVDPIGALLAVLVFEYTIATELHADSIAQIAISLFKCTVVAGAIGAAAAVGMIILVKRFLVPDFLHTVTFLASVLGAFGFANWIHPESGLVTVTVFGIVLANQKQISIHHIVEFKESLGVLLISCLFILLGSRVELRDIGDLGIGGVVFLVAMILVVRPLTVFLSTLGTGLAWKEQLFIAGLAPRGIVAAAVTAVFALKVQGLAANYPELADMGPDARKLVPITFLVIIGTVAVYGLAAAPLARWLKLADDNPQGLLLAGADDVAFHIAKAVQDVGVSVLLVDTNYQNVSAVRMAGLRGECVSILSERVHDEIDLSGIGRMLALTPNDEVNAMAVSSFEQHFGRAEVFRLPARDSQSGKRSSTGEHGRGRLLFNPKASYIALASRFDDGWVVKTTKITDEFTYEDFRELYGEQAWILFVLDSAKNLDVVAVDAALTPEPGDSVIALVDPQRKNEKERNAPTATSDLSPSASNANTTNPTASDLADSESEAGSTRATSSAENGPESRR